MTSYLCSVSFVENYAINRSRDTVIIKQLEFFFIHINRLMLHQHNGKNLNTKEPIVVSQDCLKFLGSPVTCVSPRKVKLLSKA